MKEKFDTLSAKCSKIATRHYSTSFSLGIYFFNKKLRYPVYSIYGFVRLADEIVDSFHAYNKRYLLEKFKNDCYEAIEQGISLNPVLNSFQQTVNDYGIDRELIDLFLKSMEMDLEQIEYTAQKYEEYILGSAQVVGLMCLKVFVEGDNEKYASLKSSAMKLGSAFQKVNFLRDINADYEQLCRTYFPNINISAFSNADKELIEQQIEQEFDSALQGIRQLPASSRCGVYVAFIFYKKLFQKIKSIPAEKVLFKRVRISNGYKFWLMFNSLVRNKLDTI
jgi:phytoene/squalene synthetase